MCKSWENSRLLGRRDRLRQEVLHRVDGGPVPTPRDYTGCDGTHASYYRKGWDSVDVRDIVWQCHRYKEKKNVQLN
ncbi:hypothetical protein DT73_12785 [Mangrovibacter sp. MFB070]|uniref:hypothetical protein n=1 Tax=Mangrovibacter sp. MFB070 TaxID=1224318 RepID=UPI0004D55BFD|nr:hypothetical protein [Mangrovibacter sp. MFB070]KEA51804.1 hypothetical protein DT73_12785 [Mangrovibacter sp. MFB070]